MDALTKIIRKTASFEDDPHTAETKDTVDLIALGESPSQDLQGAGAD
jgi:hypothetical protein